MSADPLIPQEISTPVQQPQTRVEIFVDKAARAVRIEFTQGEQQATFELSKKDTHTLIDGLSRACALIGNREKGAK